MVNQNIFSQKEINNYADIMIWGLKKARKKELTPNSFIEVKFDYPGLSLAEAIYVKLIENGFIPLLKQLPTPEMDRALLAKGSDEQISSFPPGLIESVSQVHGSITIIAPSSLNHLSGLDSDKISLFSRSRVQLKKILGEREMKGDYSWTLCMYPTDVMAQAAGITTKEYAQKISKACFLDKDHPIPLWKELSTKCDILKQKLEDLDIEKFHIKSENTDLIIKNGDRRKWLGISGRNIPSFELFISPDFRGTTGTYYADQPSYRSGNIIQGIRLEFKNGEIVSASAERGQEYLLKLINTDEGAKRVGEFSMTDKNFSRIDSFMANTLFDENYGGEFGNTHIALGSSYSNSFAGEPAEFTPEKKNSLGFNDSAIHWDIVNTEKKVITALLKSGKETVLYRDGEFLI